MLTPAPDELVSLELSLPIWSRFFSVAPLIVVGTREKNGSYDLAPKHMAMPLGWENYFGFVCTPRHRTYQNICREQAFTVSFPRPEQVILTSLGAAPRCEDDSKTTMAVLPTFPASVIDSVFLKDAYLFLECKLDRIVDGFGENSLIAGQIVAAYVQQQALRISEQDDQDLLLQAPLLAYLPPGRYAKIERSFSFPFHRGGQP
jgi:flavin reductase (DIM6/NTAB) family NADH-FMN oxidoreductase RutF